MGIRSHAMACGICGSYAHGRCVQSSGKMKIPPCKLPGIFVEPRAQAAATTSPLPAVKFTHQMVKGNIDALDICQLCG